MAARFRRSIVWFRRDLRLDDNVALERAARESREVVCAFVLDPVLLRSDRVGPPIVAFFFDALAELRAALRERGGELVLLQGEFGEELGELAKRLEADALYYNRDADPAASARDARVAERLEARGVRVHSSLDLTYFGPDEVRQASGAPYVVFSPYKRRWLERHHEEPRPPVDSAGSLARKALGRDALEAAGVAELEVPSPEIFGHARSADFPTGGEARGRALLATFVAERAADYADARNLPARSGTSHLSPHLRAGTVGIRRCVWSALEARDNARRKALGFDTWISELIWREFYQQILANFPHVATDPFVEAARRLPWRDDERAWIAWRDGRTGYPIVDAGMRQLERTGWMHNRVRMIVASFLTKDLLLDYRLGERHFEQRLADADLAANNGGWQWSASTGTDAAPYFRVFNPVLQSRKFDPDGAYLRTWLPELSKLDDAGIHAPWMVSPLELEAAGVRLGRDYPDPVVDHLAARDRALAAFAPVLGKTARAVKS
jgi:deoxyribodipyrimidine photo-lyase